MARQLPERLLIQRLVHGPRRSAEPVGRRVSAAFTARLLRTIGIPARRRAGRLAAHAAFWSGGPWTPRVAMGARCAFGPSVRFGAVALSAPCCFQPTEGGWVFGVFVCLGGTPPTSLHEEGASFQACAAMPQIPKPACFRCTVPVTLWMEPFRPLADTRTSRTAVRSYEVQLFAFTSVALWRLQPDYLLPPFPVGVSSSSRPRR